MTQLNSWDCTLLVKSIEAVSTVCRRICGKPNIKIVGVTNDQYDYTYGMQQGTNQSYPYITVMPNEVDDEEVSYNKFVLNNSGFTVGNSGNKVEDGYMVETRGDTVYKFQLVPIKVMLTINYFTQNTKDMWEYIQRWKVNYRKATFNLVAGNDFNVDIRTELSPNITYPEKNHESGDCYKITGTMTLHTYAGQIFEKKTVDKIQLGISLTKEQIEDLKKRGIMAAIPDEKVVPVTDNNFELIKQFELKD